MSETLIGVSACRPGEQVRYDGHRRNAFLLDELASHVRFVPVCPEPAIGIGASRETMRLVRRGDGVRVWDEGAQRRSRSGRGVIAQALVDATPGLAIEEEGRAGARPHQRRARASERPTTAGAAPAAQALLSARLRVESRGAASSALRTAAPSEVSRRSRAEVRLPPPTTRAARPPTAQAGTRAPRWGHLQDDRVPEIATTTSLAVIGAVLLATTVASVIKARRDPTARAHAGSLRAHSEPYRAVPRDVHGQHRDRAPAPTPKPYD